MFVRIQQAALKSAAFIVLCSVTAACGGGGGGGSSVTPATNNPGQPSTSNSGAGGTQYGYVANYGDGTITVFDPASNKVVSTIQTQANMTSIAANPSSPYVYIADDYAFYYAIDTRTGSITTVGTGCRPRTVAMRPSGTTVYGGEDCSPRIDVINAQTNVDTAINTPQVNGAISISFIYPNPVFKTLYIADSSQPTVGLDVYNEVSGQFIASVPTLGDPFSFAATPDGSLLFAGTWTGGVAEINTLSNERTGFVQVTSSAPATVAYSARTGLVYAADSGQNRVVVINPATMTIAQSIPVGRTPDSITTNAAGTTAYVTNDADGTVSVIDLRTNTVTATIPVGKRPRQIAIRDQSQAPGCSGKALATMLVPDSSAIYSMSTFHGVRIAGPVAQKMNLVTYDCNGTALATTYSVSASAGINVAPAGPGSYTLAAPAPLNASATLNVTASSSGGTLQTSFDVQSSPLVLQVSPNQINASDNNGVFLPLPSTSFNTGSPLKGAQAIAYNPVDGDLYVIPENSGTVLVFDLKGNLLRSIPTSDVTATAIAFDPSGTKIFVADSYFHSVIEVTTAGVVVPLAGTFSGLSYPSAIAVDPSTGNVFVEDLGNKSLFAFDSQGNAINSIALGFSPGGMTLDTNTSTIYVSNINGSVAGYSLALAPKAGYSTALYQPGTLAYDNSTQGTFVISIAPGGSSPAAMGPAAAQGEIFYDNGSNRYTGNPIDQSFGIRPPEDVGGMTIVP